MNERVVTDGTTTTTMMRRRGGGRKVGSIKRASGTDDQLSLVLVPTDSGVTRAKA
jgi:hypothetical protein